MQTNAGRVLGGDRLLKGADFQRRHRAESGQLRLAEGVDPFEVAREAAVAANVAVLHFDDASIQFRVAIASKAERADDLQQSKHGGLLHVINDARAALDQDSRPGRRQFAVRPGLRIRPIAVGDTLSVEVNVLSVMMGVAGRGGSGIRSRRTIEQAKARVATTRTMRCITFSSKSMTMRGGRPNESRRAESKWAIGLPSSILAASRENGIATD